MDEHFVAARKAHVSSFSQEPVLPPVNFEYYGLPSSWHGLRWLDVINGDWAALWLGHRSLDFESGLLVGTLPRSIFDRWSDQVRADRDHITAALSLACQRFIQVVSPDPEVAGPPGVRTANHRYVEQQVENYANWSLKSWNIQGESASARVWSFAGGWIGLCEDLTDAHLVVVGVGIAFESLVLDIVQDSAMYGVDLTAPLTASGMRGRRTSEMVMPHPNQRRWRPEQLDLLGN